MEWETVIETGLAYNGHDQLRTAVFRSSWDQQSPWLAQLRYF
jgi:hypothetical protein